MEQSVERLPMFPLGSVVFPFVGIPLRVFEPRYLKLVDRVVAEGSSFGTVLIERGFEVGGGDVRNDVGTRLRILAQHGLDDGHRVIMVAGIERIRVVEWLEDDPHPWALVERVDESHEEVGPLLSDARHRLVRLLAMASELGADTADIDLDMEDDALAASFQLSALIPVTPLDSYSLLTAAGARQRLERAVVLIDEQTELIRLQLAGS